MWAMRLLVSFVLAQAAAAVASTTTQTSLTTSSSHQLHLHGTLHTDAAIAALAAAPTAPSTINVTALIDPTHGSTLASTATFSPPLSNPSPTGSAHYIFVFGDSYSELGFNISGTKPSPLNPLGNPSYPGLTPEVGMQNWVDLVTVHAGITALTYDFAVGGASVNNSLTEGSNAKVPSFENQSDDFVAVLGVTPRPSYAQWSTEDSVVIIWLGRNDIYWTLINGVAEPRAQLDEAQISFLAILTRLVNVGATRFVVLGVPPFEREPLWRKDYFDQFVPVLPGLVEYWNSGLQAQLKNWMVFYPDVIVNWVDTAPAFDMVLDSPARYGAPDAMCTNENARPPSNGTNCLWADDVHPGPAINAAVAKVVGQELIREGFFPNASPTTSTSASATAAVEGGKSARVSDASRALDLVCHGWWEALMLAAISMHILNMIG